jgi:nucleoid-associated protein YgaU
MNQQTVFSKYFKSSEEVVSMFLGLVIVVVVGGLIFNYFQKNRGTVNIPGITDQKVSVGDKLNNDQQTLRDGTKTYTVVPGDNLWKIAQKTYGDGNKWTEIATENKLANPGVLVSGQVLVLPGVGEQVVSNSYTVVAGDSLWKIASNNYNDGYKWVEILNSNKNVLRDPGKIEVGMSLILPKL